MVEVNNDDPGPGDNKKKFSVYKRPSDFRCTLLEVYAKESFPSEKTIGELSEKLGLTHQQLRSWFCRKRCEERKEYLRREEWKRSTERAKRQRCQEELNERETEEDEDESNEVEDEEQSKEGEDESNEVEDEEQSNEGEDESNEVEDEEQSNEDEDESNEVEDEEQSNEGEDESNGQSTEGDNESNEQQMEDEEQSNEVNDESDGEQTEDDEEESCSGEKELNLVQLEIDKCNRELNSKKAELSDCDHQMLTKKNKLCELQKSLMIYRAELQTEKENLDSVTTNIQRCSKLLKARNETLDTVKKRTENEEMKLNCLKERIKHYEEMDAMHKSIEGHRKECELEFISLREERMSVKKSKTDEELVLKQTKIDSMSKSIDEKEIQLGVLGIVCREYLRELQERKTHFDSLKRTTQERVEELEEKGKQLEERAKNLESQNNEQCSNSLISLSPILQSCIIGNGMKLQTLLNDQLRKNDLANLEIFEFIKMSPDPASLVLDAMKGFYTRGLDNRHDSSVIRRSCITLLEQVIKMSPQIAPCVKEKALKVAMEWKENMKVRQDNSVEAMAFLKLLAAYKLDSAFSGDEIQNILRVIESKQKIDLHEAFGKGIPVQPSECFDSDPVCSLSANSLSSVTDSERSPELLLNDIVTDHNLTDAEVSTALQFSPDPAKFVLDVMLGSYFKFWNNGTSDALFTKNIVRMLEELMKLSYNASHQVKEVALKQVLLWKEKISLEPQNSLEILAFLMFLAVYDLVSYFRRDEVLQLVETIVHYKQAPEICRILGFTDEIANLTSNLIQRNQFLEAARFSSLFGLSMKFLPETILSKYLQNTWMEILQSSKGSNSFEEQCKSIDEEVAALADFLECVNDCKLQSIFPPERFNSHIAERQAMKERLSQPFSAPPHMPQQQQDHMSQQALQGQSAKESRGQTKDDRHCRTKRRVTRLPQHLTDFVIRK